MPAGEVPAVEVLVVELAVPDAEPLPLGSSAQPARSAAALAPSAPVIARRRVTIVVRSPINVV